jgi:spermidine synthase
MLGDSVTQFSTIIGVYLFSMGIGSYLSKFIKRNLLVHFVKIELLIGLLGGTSAAILFVCFSFAESFRLVLYGLISLIGILVGMEIPLMMRILESHLDFTELVSKVLTFDYIGALIASILFPILFVPHLGLIRTAIVFGILNILVGWWTLKLFQDKCPKELFGHLQNSAIVIILLLALGFAYSNKIMSFSEEANFQQKAIFSKSSPYQRIVLTTDGKEFRLFLNGNLQFSSSDEYRYHEALIHPGLALVKNPKQVLILGGGDGLAAREVLKYSTVESVTLVDLDKDLTNLFKKHKLLKNLNQNSLNSPKLKVVSADAFFWLKRNKAKFDFIVIDFPDPNNFSLGKLYSDTFYKVLKSSLKEQGLFVVQSTSPFYAKKSFWCVVNTINSVGFNAVPYHAYVPSFGEWGFILASSKAINPKSPLAQNNLPANLKFISQENIQSLFDFPADMSHSSTCINKLNNQDLVRTFDEEWGQYVGTH